MAFIGFILVGLVAGWLAGKIMGSGGFGVLGDIGVGIVGAMVGGFVFSHFGLHASGGFIGSVLVATVGAVILLAIIRAIKRA
ncbi:GlsB/YeaQ/YmgE family stress response membrane protein [Andreprevotia chitinilytica]|uniref:GlsB/YeaQ/YmgE family stress response membrane protein n=1 Tax=Andreprevotia chitinilytica TaxID=396808 RepID=UPI00054E11C8|nr:GlsB/YeaQ/YmgE family stress response membrane protein [Andreprevotia chitinilytica]